MSTPDKKIQLLRKKIDHFDMLICKNLNNRKKIVKNIMLIKRKNKASAKDSKREIDIINKLTKKHPNISKEIRCIYKVLFHSSYLAHKDKA